jgi:putative SOS response-associated peptidase YedK
MVGIHDRMPVVLGAEHLDRWLDPQLESVPEQLLKSDLAGGLEAWPVSSEVNSIRNDGPQLIRPTSLVRPSMDLNPEAVDQEDLFGRPWNDSMR